MSEVKTEPKKFADLSPKWVMVNGRDEVYGIRYNCPCGLPVFEPICEDGEYKLGDDGKLIGLIPYAQCCAVGGWVAIPTKTNWLGKPSSADAMSRGWDLSGTSFENITLNPSIHCVGHWHGWLQDGVLRSC